MERLCVQFSSVYYAIFNVRLYLLQRLSPVVVGHDFSFIPTKNIVNA